MSDPLNEPNNPQPRTPMPYVHRRVCQIQPGKYCLHPDCPDKTPDPVVKWELNASDIRFLGRLRIAHD